MNKLPEWAKNKKGPAIRKTANNNPNNTARKHYGGAGSVIAN